MKVHRKEAKARRLASGTLEHGKASTYGNGCRCNDCKAAYSASRAAALTVVEGPGPRSPGDLESLAGYWAVFEEGKGLSLETRTSYNKSVRALIEWLESKGRRNVAEITSRDMSAYFAEISNRITRYGKPPEKSSIATTYRHLQQWFKWLIAEGELSASPMEGQTAQKQTIKPAPVIHDEHLRALLGSFGSSFEDRRTSRTQDTECTRALYAP
jgi:site-specific recombinase XerD